MCFSSGFKKYFDSQKVGKAANEVINAATPTSAAAHAINPLIAAAVLPGDITYRHASTLAAVATKAAASSTPVTETDAGVVSTTKLRRLRSGVSKTNQRAGKKTQ